MIPAVAHFVWLGREFPWVYALAVMTAARRGGFERVCLHHADGPDDGPGWRAARDEPRVELVPLEPSRLLAAVPEHGPALQRLYARITAPAARANMIRAAILHAEGGVYLDTDTLTVAPLDPLREARAFCGLEHILMPYTVWRSRSPLVWGRTAAVYAMRDLLRRLPTGHRHFSLIASLCHEAPNNAVLGAEPEHPFVADLLEGMVRMPAARQTVRFALGTSLLQEKVAGTGPGREALQLHPPEVFYPLAPEISEHWFRERDRVALGEAVTGRTRVIHWYASVRTRAIVPDVDEGWLRARTSRQLFAKAAVRALDGEPLLA